jgi:hypothetical protein
MSESEPPDDGSRPAEHVDNYQHHSGNDHSQWPSQDPQALRIMQTDAAIE